MGSGMETLMTKGFTQFVILIICPSEVRKCFNSSQQIDNSGNNKPASFHNFHKSSSFLSIVRGHSKYEIIFANIAKI